MHVSVFLVHVTSISASQIWATNLNQSYAFISKNIRRTKQHEMHQILHT